MHERHRLNQVLNIVFHENLSCIENANGETLTFGLILKHFGGRRV